MIPALLWGALSWAGPTLDAPGEVMPDRHWDLLHLDLQLQLDPAEGTLEGLATHTLRPLGRAAGWVTLHQVGLDIHEITVEGRRVDGWERKPDALRIPVPFSRAPIRVAIRYEAQPTQGMYFRGGPDGPEDDLHLWTQGQPQENRHWYPGWDYPNDTFTVSTRIVVPEAMIAFSNGEAVDPGPAPPGYSAWAYAQRRPIANHLVAVVAGELSAVEAEGPVPLTFIAPASVPEDALRRTLAPTAEILSFFESILDTPFPYPLYRQAFVSRFLYAGMENATLTTLADGHLLTEPDSRDPLIEPLIAHELAHHWFGNLLTCYGWRELWLSEGFATFYAARWMEHRYGPERYAAEVHGWKAGALADAGPMAPRGWSRIPGRDHAAVYPRGAAFLHLLRTWLGDATFDEAVRTYLHRNADRLVQTEDLRRAFEDLSGMHLGWLFDLYVHRGAMPAFASAWRIEERPGGPHLVIELSPREAPGPRLPITVEIGTADEVQRQQIWTEPERTRLERPIDSPPLWVAVDPDGGVLADWSHDQPPEAWLAQLQHSPSPAARIAAIEHLAQAYLLPQAVPALEAVLRGSSVDPAIRALAAQALGNLGGDRAFEALIAAAELGAPAVRQGVIEAMAQAPPAQADRILPVLLTAAADPDPWIRASALKSLASTHPERATRLARQRLAAPDPSPQAGVHEQALLVLADHGERRDLRLTRRFLAPTVAREARQAAALATTRLIQRLDGPERAHAEAVAALRALSESADRTDRQLAAKLLDQLEGAADRARPH